MQISCRHLLIITVLAASPLASAVGCGSGSSNSGSGASSSTSTTSMPGTGGTTTTSMSTGGTTTSSSSTTSMSTGGTAGMGTGGMPGDTCTGSNGSACMMNGVNGLCEGGMCSTCNDPTDDATCTAAYGTASLCLAGVCTPGNCRTDTDCATAGQICGVSKPNFCGKCTTDGQCHADPTYGTGDICDTAAGTCVSNACTNNGHACANNAKDFCCNAACVPGNCCVTSDCTGANQTCQKNKCTTCALPTGNTYYVDPMNGDDGVGTGSAMGGGNCDFKTITRALEFIGPTPAAGTKIEILNNTPAGANETFPITVPKNVTIEGATAGTPSTVQVAANSLGFWLDAANSSLNNLIVDGMMGAGTTGIAAHSGATATTTLTAVEVKNMALDGIQAVGSATLSIGSGVSSHDNGAAGSQQQGLLVTGSAKVTITANTGDTAPVFNNNTGHGILVNGTGSVTIGGTLSPAARASANGYAGLYIIQTPGNAVPLNSVTNLLAQNSTNGNGITVHGGSALKLRSSTTKGNKNYGIWVTTYVNGTTKSDDLSQIDLGSAVGGAGGNTFQAAVGNNPNGDSGICLQLTLTAGQTLNAQGNVFEAANCATTAATLMHTANACAAGSDYGILGAVTTNKIDLTKCM